MKRPTKSFVVEIKRSARKASGPKIAPAWDIAAILPARAADPIPKLSQTAASAVFQKKSDASPTSDPARAERRILPVLAVEPCTTTDVSLADAPLQPTAGFFEAIQPKSSSRKPKAPECSEDSETLTITAGPPAAAATTDRDTDETSVPGSAPNSARRPRGWLLQGEDALPPGERWKRRLPRVMR